MPLRRKLTARQDPGYYEVDDCWGEPVKVWTSSEAYWKWLKEEDEESERREEKERQEREERRERGEYSSAEDDESDDDNDEDDRSDWIFPNTIEIDDTAPAWEGADITTGDIRRVLDLISDTLPPALQSALHCGFDSPALQTPTHLSTAAKLPQVLPQAIRPARPAAIRPASSTASTSRSASKKPHRMEPPRRQGLRAPELLVRTERAVKLYRICKAS
ncbi:hypothetical protein D9611_010241 [Ephemerocybe angulata]|uniref:Uncharacterized protein n=1 Tax=Ephemerocybe angulata TaxID=980116 RepID=A0A8H5EVN9_9AGAR|nr:hypothetical protein D9611_010241 [Tulosesus angulatus]